MLFSLSLSHSLSRYQSLSRYLFWTDYGFDHPRIERADLTGENRTIVVEFGYDWYFQIFPMSVIIEYETETIYWIDRYDNYIDQADLDGNNKANLEFIVQNINPADLALYGDYLYWADRNSRSIEYFNKTEGKGQHYNFGHLTDDTPAGVVVSDESRQPVGNWISFFFSYSSALVTSNALTIQWNFAEISGLKVTALAHERHRHIKVLEHVTRAEINFPLSNNSLLFFLQRLQWTGHRVVLTMEGVAISVYWLLMEEANAPVQMV